jgi:hypothetical protein
MFTVLILGWRSNGNVIRRGEPYARTECAPSGCLGFSSNSTRRLQEQIKLTVSVSFSPKKKLTVSLLLGLVATEKRERILNFLISSESTEPASRTKATTGTN